MTVNKELLRKSIDWLRANPDRHITGSLAVDEKGKVCDPTSEGAHCFCMLGRLARDAGVADKSNEIDNFDQYAETVLAVGLTTDRNEASEIAGLIYGMNDRCFPDYRLSPLCIDEFLSNQEILARLEADYLS